jgi:hypothetical protein
MTGSTIARHNRRGGSRTSRKPGTIHSPRKCVTGSLLQDSLDSKDGVTWKLTGFATVSELLHGSGSFGSSEMGADF